jgi:hypothetical protein
VEECEASEVEAAQAVVRLMYEEVVPPGLDAVALAQVGCDSALCGLNALALNCCTRARSFSPAWWATIIAS